ncbi:MAG: hypothetical protein RJA70_4918 [Pseudomonadota bacterium]|jgi:hypothetical protein
MALTALSNVAQPDDETITYRVQHENQLRVMTPMQFMARLAALIPPPRHPLIRFHGVFAPHSRFRKQVVPAPAEVRSEQATACGQAAPPQPATPTDPAPPVPQHAKRKAANSALEAVARPARETESISRIDRATLLRRVYTIDALACPRCGDRMRFTDLFEQRQLARQELARRGLATHPPPLARARSPDSCGD